MSSNSIKLKYKNAYLLLNADLKRQLRIHEDIKKVYQNFDPKTNEWLISFNPPSPTFFSKLWKIGDLKNNCKFKAILYFKKEKSFKATIINKPDRIISIQINQ